MNKKILKYSLITVAAATLFMPMAVLADEEGNIDLTVERLVKILNNIKDWFAGIIFTIGIIAILYAAFLYLIAGGDETKIQKAKKTLVWGIVGIIVALLAYGIWTTIYNFLKAS